LLTESAGCLRSGRGTVRGVRVTALWKAWWLHRCASVAAADCHPAGQPQSYRFMQLFAPFVCRTSCGQNVKTHTGRKQLMESLRERKKKKGHSIVVSNLKWKIFQLFNRRNRK